MVTRTFLSKCTTIFMDSEDNFGLHPIGMLNRGLIVSRALIKFDTDKISSRMLDGTYLNRNNLKHVLKLYNCGSIDNKKFGNPIPSNDYNGEKIRNTSFSIIVFPIPKEWDRGVGFDNSDDIWFVGNSKKSTQGCNWYQAKNGVLWDNEGIISTDQLRVEYTKYLNGEDSIIIASQHFDYGNEDFSIDITDYVNDIVDGKIKDNGLCICFAPTDDADDDKITKYTGFFTDKTNTFYEPYLESKYDEIIFDDRNNFKIGAALLISHHDTAVRGSNDHAQPQRIRKAPAASREIRDRIHGISLRNHALAQPHIHGVDRGKHHGCFRSGRGKGSKAKDKNDEQGNDAFHNTHSFSGLSVFRGFITSDGRLPPEVP